MHRVWIGAVACVGLAGAGLSTDRGLLAWPGAEAWGHLWVQWWHGQALPAWPRGTLLAEGATHWPVIDPATTALAAALGQVLGGVLTWNLLALVAVATAFAGGAAVARVADGDPVVGGTVLALSPIALGSVASGLTEDWAWGLAALGLAALHGRRPWLGGLAVGACAWCGLYLALGTAGAAVVVGAAIVLRGRHRLTSMVAAGLVAAFVAAPALWLQGERLQGEGHRAGTPAVGFEPAWRVNPWHGADLASLVMPGPAALGGDELLRLHPAYLGLVALALAGLGLARSGLRWRWTAVLGAGLVVAPGTALRWQGAALGIDNPGVALVQALPYGDLPNHWARFLIPASIGLAALAARGSVRLGRWAPLAAVAVAVELAWCSPAPLPLPVANAEIAAVWSALGEQASDGAVLVVPVAGPGVHHQRPLYEQRAHGHRLALRPNQPGRSRASRTDLGRWLAGLSQPQPPQPPGKPDRGALLEAGVAWVAVREAWVPAVVEVLGAPDLEADGGAAWSMLAE